MAKRHRWAPTDTGQQRELRFTSPEQGMCELMRPVVLGGPLLSTRTKRVLVDDAM